MSSTTPVDADASPPTRGWSGVRVVVTDDPTDTATRLAARFGTAPLAGWDAAVAHLRSTQQLVDGASAVRLARARREAERVELLAAAGQSLLDSEEVDRLQASLRAAAELVTAAERNIALLRRREREIRAELAELGELGVPDTPMVEELARTIQQRRDDVEQARAAVGPKPESARQGRRPRRSDPGDDEALAAWARARGALDAAVNALVAAEQSVPEATDGRRAADLDELLDQARRRDELRNEMAELITEATTSAPSLAAAGARWSAAVDEAGLDPIGHQRVDEATAAVEGRRRPPVLELLMDRGPGSIDRHPDDAEREDVMRLATRALVTWSSDELGRALEPVVVRCERSALDPPPSPRVLTEVAQRSAGRPVVLVSGRDDARRWGDIWVLSEAGLS